jgi:GT2 family glycosyltransferase
MTSVAEKNVEMPAVAVVIVNWNSWSDCLECLESLFRQDYSNAGFIICDNGSTDDSLEKIKAWAAGTEAASEAPGTLKHLTSPPVIKPVPLEIDPKPAISSGSVHLIKSGENLGFAGGNNIALQHALDAGYDYAWVLNADTVGDQGALSALVNRVREDSRIGLCGSILCYYDAPEIVQEVGGCQYFPLIGIARRLAGDKTLKELSKIRSYERRLSYVSAASCLVSRDFLQEVGLMSEDYFLYCEEIDWATRARSKFQLGIAEESLVYHKKGRATGSKSMREGRSISSTYYLWRARGRFTRRFFRYGLPGFYMFGAMSWLSLVLSGRPKAASALIDGLVDKAMRH